MKKVVSLLLGLVLLLNCSVGCAEAEYAFLDGMTLDELKQLKVTIKDVEKEVDLRIALLSNEATPVDRALGTDNAFYELFGRFPESYQEWKQALEGMVLAMAFGFNSGQLGVDTVQASISGLVPESVYINKKSNNEKMQAIYDYFASDKLVNYFVIDFDRDGEPIDSELDLDGVKKFVEDCIDCGVFAGSWESFYISPEATSLDEFCQKMNITKELAVGMFFVIESYNMNSDGKSSTFLNYFFPQ